MVCCKEKNNRHLKKKISKLNNMKNDVNNFLKYYYEYDEFINLYENDYYIKSKSRE